MSFEKLVMLIDLIERIVLVMQGERWRVGTLIEERIA